MVRELAFHLSALSDFDPLHPNPQETLIVIPELSKDP